MKGVFITFEGSEGCGKSTQSKMAAAYLRRKGRAVVYLREPGGAFLSEKIRKILLDPKNKSISAACETLLYMAARAQVVDEIIAPALAKGKIILCDRFLDSTLAYQGYGLGIEAGLIRRLGILATRGIKPDLTVLLDLPVKKGLRKCGGRKDRIEQRSLKYHLRVRRGYLALARQEPARIKIIRVDKDKTATQKNIRKLIDNFLKQAG